MPGNNEGQQTSQQQSSTTDRKITTVSDVGNVIGNYAYDNPWTAGIGAILAVVGTAWGVKTWIDYAAEKKSIEGRAKDAEEAEKKRQERDEEIIKRHKEEAEKEAKAMKIQQQQTEEARLAKEQGYQQQIEVYSYKNMQLITAVVEQRTTIAQLRAEVSELKQHSGAPSMSEAQTSGAVFSDCDEEYDEILNADMLDDDHQGQLEIYLKNRLAETEDSRPVMHRRHSMSDFSSYVESARTETEGNQVISRRYSMIDLTELTLLSTRNTVREIQDLEVKSLSLRR
ncbi:MAG: hypothetical protein CMF50_07300 [Legionellales bacterium]|nr:hypothetical protein [Legionellales bacterium]|tara:strand:- start:59551 stop:60402 length:852 start_codon:yes stop_codon:yes gene_type:complete